MPGELRPHSLIPSSLQLIVVHLEAGASRDAEAIAVMLATTDIPRGMSGAPPVRYQALAVRRKVSELLVLIQKKDVLNALTVARAALVVLEEIEKTGTKD